MAAKSGRTVGVLSGEKGGRMKEVCWAGRRNVFDLCHLSERSRGMVTADLAGGK